MSDDHPYSTTHNMNIPKRRTLNIVSSICRSERLVASPNQLLKVSLLAASGTVIGGLAFGPIGMGIGLLLGGCAGVAQASLSRRDVPVSTYIQDLLNKKEKDELVAHIWENVVDSRSVDDIFGVSPFMKNEIIRVVRQFFYNELSMTVSKYKD